MNTKIKLFMLMLNARYYGDVSSSAHSPIYSPLDAAIDQLRIMNLDPGEGRSYIKVSLEPTPFAERPYYMALSYAWGNEDPSHKIWINNNALLVRKPLRDAIHSLRDTKTVLPLWVDAICIDQENAEEKSRQVAMMAFIYRRAKKVIVWLGVHDIPFNFAAEDLEPLAAKLSQFKLQEPERFKYIWETLEPWLHELIYEEYWKRLWIIQEICHATRLHIHFGSGFLEWNTFLKLVMIYQDLHPRDERANIIVSLAVTRTNIINGGEAYSLSSLLNTCRNSFCKDPRDKIYGLLPMVSDHIGHRIPVNYSISLPGLYEAVIRYLTLSTSDPEKVNIELVYIAALVRSLLTRKAELVPFTLKKSQSSRARTPTKAGFINEKAEWQMLSATKDLIDHPIGFWRATAIADPTVASYDQVVYGFIVNSITQLAKWIFTSRMAWSEDRYTMSYHSSLPENEIFWASENSTRPFASENVTVKGSRVGKVERIGPTVANILSSFNTTQEWGSIVINHFQTPEDQKRARVQHERLHTILSHSPSAMYKHVRSLELANDPHALKNKRSEIDDYPHVIIASNVTLGLVSPQTQIGDLIYQFWNSSTAAVVRRISGNNYRVIGRAVVLQQGQSLNWDIPLERHRFSSDSPSSLDLELDLDTLTALSLDTVDLPYYI